MIFKDSRYTGVALYTVTDRQGRSHRALTIRVVPPTPAVFRHLVAEADRLDLLSFKYYSKADRFWRIADANNEMRPEDLLQPGRRILVPPDQSR
jgi:nucleoid-associated protein YgaU